jgi:hypothetical protein
MKIYFKPDPDRLTFDEVIAMQEGKMRVAREVMVRFVTDEDGNPVEADAASEAVGSIPLSQLNDVITAFVQQIDESMKDVLPNGRGRNSGTR